MGDTTLRLIGFCRALRDLIHFSGVGLVANALMLGAVSVSPDLAWTRVAALGVAGLTFHIYLFLLNDIVDLPLDRTSPERAGFPLVTGAIGRGPALAIALAQVPVTFAVVVWLGGGIAAMAALVAAFVLGAVYDLWSKRVPLPAVMDTVLGLTFAVLVLTGALVERDGLEPITVVVAVCMALAIVMINGVHGALRDVSNDASHGCRTSALMLGVRQLGDGTLLITQRFHVYAGVLQAMLVATAFLQVGLLWNRYESTTLSLALTALALLAVGLWVLYIRMGPAVASGRGGVPHMMLVLLTPVVASALYAPPALVAWMVVLYVGPLLTSDKTPAALRFALANATGRVGTGRGSGPPRPSSR